MCVPSGKSFVPLGSQGDSNEKQIIDKYQFNEKLILVLDDLFEICQTRRRL